MVAASSLGIKNKSPAVKGVFWFCPKIRKKKAVENSGADTKNADVPQTEKTQSSLPESSQTESLAVASTPPQASAKEPIPGHGRNAASLYTGAEMTVVKHESLKAGDPCPEGCGGKLYSYLPGVVIRITGNPIITAKKYVIEKLRCALCLMLFTAKLPEDAKKPKYDEPAKAVVAFNKYYLGMPFNRIQMSQNLMGVPLPDSTQWDLINALTPMVKPVFLALVQFGVQGKQVYQDDTTVKILELIRENKNKKADERTGMHTTGMLFLREAYKIYLFYSGRNHAGENLDRVLSQRETILGPIRKMSDALGSNHTKTPTIDCNCLAHGRRKFYEIHPFFPEECGFIIGQLAWVYQVDGETKEMSEDERLLHHQTKSAPVMDILKAEIEKKLTAKEVEPNGSLGKAYKYLLNHWTGLTQFLRIPGAPLDNNVIERALKIPIRNRKAALFYKTLYGAQVGDMLMSLIYTCAEAGRNPVDYLTALQVHAGAVKQHPAAWLPWNYRDNFTEQISSAV